MGGDKVNNIFFDLDGTLTDPKEGITKSVAYALKSFGIEVENLDDLIKFIGPPLIDSFIEYYGFSEKEAKSAVLKYREYFSKIGLYENAIFDGIKELLEALKSEGKNLIVATSKPAVFAIEILKHFEILEYFTFVSGSELDGSRTDKAEVISYALSKNNIADVTDVIMIGDRKHDIIGARKLGIKAIGVLYGYGDLEELKEASADYIVQTVEELKTYLEK